LRRQSLESPSRDLELLAREWHIRHDGGKQKPLAVTIVARNQEELGALIDQGTRLLVNGGETGDTFIHPSLRDRLFFSPAPLGGDGKIAFVFPGSGNHYPGMGMELSCRWPEIFRRQDLDNLYLRNQFQPETFWSGASPAEISDNHRAVIFGQVATG